MSIVEWYIFQYNRLDIFYLFCFPNLFQFNFTIASNETNLNRITNEIEYQQYMQGAVAFQKGFDFIDSPGIQFRERRMITFY